MLDPAKFSDNPDADVYKKIFSIVERDAPGAFIADSANASGLSVSACEDIRQIMVDQVSANMIADGYQSLDDAKSKLIIDSYFNEATGINTALDPSSYNMADIPTILTPNEATAYYSSGGIGQQIINKKSYGILTNGYTFEGVNWSDDECQQLKEYADSIGFDRALGDGMRDGLIYGGSLVIPALKGDTPTTYRMTIDQLISRKMIDKDCIDYLWTSDRWNSVLIPDYNISAKSYLTPNEFMIPLAGVSVATKRIAVIRPKKLPYWATIRQMGWSISEFEGWIVSLLGYEIMAQSISTMFQQQSLMYHSIPMDGMIAQNGPDVAKEYAKFNSQQLAQWSVVKHRTANVIGEIKTVERNYANMDALLMAKRQDLAAKTGLPESVLFLMNPQGLASDRESDVTLKQSETLKAIGNNIIPQTQDLVKLMVYSCFGLDSEQAKRADKLRLSFDSPTIMTDQQKAETGEKFFAMVTNGVTAGMPIDMAVGIAHEFVPSADIPQEYLDRLEEQPLPQMPDEQAASDAYNFFQQGGTDQAGAQGTDQATAQATGEAAAQATPSSASNFINPQPEQPQASDSAVQDFVNPKSPLQKFFGGIKDMFRRK
jgi:hypothetical protein